jgi:hypothetical protein
MFESPVNKYFFIFRISEFVERRLTSIHSEEKGGLPAVTYELGN